MVAPISKFAVVSVGMVNVILDAVSAKIISEVSVSTRDLEAVSDKTAAITSPVGPREPVNPIGPVFE